MTKPKAKPTKTKTEAKRSKTRTKAKRSITKASTSKTAATKSSSPTSDDICLLVLGFDEQQKPCGARFVGDKPDLVAKAAQLMGLSVYKASAPDVAEIAKKLPIGRLYANGRAFVPNVRQTLYSEVIVALAAEPQQAAVGTDDDAGTPVARGLPPSWDEIAPGHLVIAQESLANGWWEAIVLDRNDDMLTLRFRDYPRLPHFFRHCTAVALMSPASAQ